MNTPHETENTKPQAASTPPSDEKPLSIASLTVGAGVGLAMSVNTGDGKTVGDRVADLGERAYDGAKNLLKGILG